MTAGRSCAGLHAMSLRCAEFLRTCEQQQPLDLPLFNTENATAIHDVPAGTSEADSLILYGLSVQARNPYSMPGPRYDSAALLSLAVMHCPCV